MPYFSTSPKPLLARGSVTSSSRNSVSLHATNAGRSPSHRHPIDYLCRHDPRVQFLVATLTLILGAGLIIACLRGDKNSPEDIKFTLLIPKNLPSLPKKCHHVARQQSEKLTTKSASRSTTRSAKPLPRNPPQRPPQNPLQRPLPKSSQ